MRDTLQIRLIAYDRPAYLAKVVAGLQAMYGIHDCHIVASIDALPAGGHHRDVVDLCRSLTDDVRLRPEHLDCNRHVLGNLKEGLDEADEVLYLEDDVVPATDALRFCRTHNHFLDHGSVYDLQINAITLLGEEWPNAHLAYRARNAFKAHKWFNPWGLYLSRHNLGRLLQQFRSEWLLSDDVPWDQRLQQQVFVDHDWLSLTPTLSRVRNIGVTGRYTKTAGEYLTRHRTFWSDSDYSSLIAANWH